MTRWTHAGAMLALAAAMAQATIVDRIAIIVDNQIIKDSDIAEDLRVTAFLNKEPAANTPANRKKTASRLIDQMLIRREIASGEYPVASAAEIQALMDDLKARYAGETAYKAALASRGVDEETLKARLLWQLTVLRFIDARFRPAVVITDEDIEKYFNQNRQALQRSYPNLPQTLDGLRQQIEDVLAGERVNQLLDDWLDRRRRNTRTVFLESDLK